jgi:hypothetical protein
MHTIDILLLFLAALLRCPYAIEQKHLELVMVVKGHYELGYSFLLHKIRTGFPKLETLLVFIDVVEAQELPPILQ